MVGVQKFLSFVYDNWTAILVCIGLIVGVVKKTIDFLNNSTKRKIEIVKDHLNEIILKKITDAEIDFIDWNKAGAIKRSQVIAEIYEEYPILSKAINQEDIIAYIDELINDALKTLRNIVKENETHLHTSD